jgi:hypothetical protein
MLNRYQEVAVMSQLKLPNAKKVTHTQTTATHAPAMSLDSLFVLDVPVMMDHSSLILNH